MVNSVKDEEHFRGLETLVFAPEVLVSCFFLFVLLFSRVLQRLRGVFACSGGLDEAEALHRSEICLSSWLTSFAAVISSGLSS